jgi:hypothetical protein
LTSALDGGEWSVLRPGRFTPGERAPSIHWRENKFFDITFRVPIRCAIRVCFLSIDGIVSMTVWRNILGERSIYTSTGCLAIDKLACSHSSPKFSPNAPIITTRDEGVSECRRGSTRSERRFYTEVSGQLDCQGVWRKAPQHSFYEVDGNLLLTFNILTTNSLSWELLVHFITFTYISRSSLVVIIIIFHKLGLLACSGFRTYFSENYESIWTVGRTPWTGDRPDARHLPTYRTTRHKKTRTHI